MAWYTSPGGTTCVAAYNAVGASSLANSYVNLANPGTFDAAPGVAPTWASGTGWTFNGTTQYLTTGVTPSSGWSAIVRFSGRTSSGYLFGESNGGASGGRLAVLLTTNTQYWNGANPALAISRVPTSGVIGVAGQAAYFDGAAESGTLTAWSGAAFGPIYIGTRNAPDAYYGGNIQALAIYSGTLTAADVATITAAMNALPVAGLLPSMLQHAAMGWR